VEVERRQHIQIKACGGIVPSTGQKKTSKVSPVDEDGEKGSGDGVVADAEQKTDAGDFVRI